MENNLLSFTFTQNSASFRPADVPDQYLGALFGGYGVKVRMYLLQGSDDGVGEDGCQAGLRVLGRHQRL